jgi:hypothetical protein
MGTYYNYAEKNADSQINWASVGKDITTMLDDEMKIREAKKAEIDKKSRELGIELTKFPQGTHANANKWTLDYANDATQAILMQDRLLKNGSMSVKDYTLMRQNITDGTSQVFNLAKEFQAEFKIKSDRRDAGLSQDFESDLAAWSEGFADFSKSKILINPTDFTLSVGIMAYNDKSKVDELTGKVITVADMSRSIKKQYNKFDSQGASAKIANGLATVVLTTIEEGTLNTSGAVITTENALQKENTKKALKLGIESYLSLDTNVTSILTNDLLTYENTFSKEEADKNPNLIYWKIDGSGNFEPVLNAAQKEAAFKYMETQTSAMVAEKVTKDRFVPLVVGKEERKISVEERAKDRAHDTALTKMRIDADINAAKLVKAELGTNLPPNYSKKYDNAVQSLENLLVSKNEEVSVTALGNSINGLGFTVKQDVRGKDRLTVTTNILDIDNKIVNSPSITIATNGSEKQNMEQMELLRDFMRANKPNTYQLIDMNNKGLFDVTQSEADSRNAEIGIAPSGEKIKSTKTSTTVNYGDK